MSLIGERFAVPDQPTGLVPDRFPGSESDGLAWQNLVCLRGGRRLFGPLTSRLEPGDLLWVRGANGAGKTSLLRILCGLMAATEGEIFWGGRPIGDLQEDFCQHLIFLGHLAALKEDLTPLENLLIACQLSGQDISEMQARSALSDAGLQGREDTPVRHLSQGQRRRSALARLSTGSAAALWILDEPFNALDKTATAWLASVIRDHQSRSGMVILTTHQDVPLSDIEQRVLDL